MKQTAANCDEGTKDQTNYNEIGEERNNRNKNIYA